MAQRNYEARCPGVEGTPCDFIGRGAKLANARRAVRGHALRHHGMGYASDAPFLTPLSAAELQSRLEAFRRDQYSAAQRRHVDEIRPLMDNLEEVAAGDGTGFGSEAGLLAGLVRGGVRFPDSPPPPDLSAGQVLPQTAASGPAANPSPQPNREAATQVRFRADLGSNIALPAPGLSIADLTELVFQHPVSSPGELIALLEEQRGCHFTASERRQLMGFVTTAVAAERTLCRRLVMQWNAVALSPEETERRAALSSILGRVKEGANRFVSDDDCGAVGTGDAECLSAD